MLATQRKAMLIKDLEAHLVEPLPKQMVAFSFDFSFFFPLLKEAKARASIPIRALLLLKSDFFNFNVFLAF